MKYSQQTLVVILFFIFNRYSQILAEPVNNRLGDRVGFLDVQREDRHLLEW